MIIFDKYLNSKRTIYTHGFYNFIMIFLMIKDKNDKV